MSQLIFFLSLTTCYLGNTLSLVNSSLYLCCRFAYWVILQSSFSIKFSCLSGIHVQYECQTVWIQNCLKRLLYQQMILNVKRVNNSIANYFHICNVTYTHHYMGPNSGSMTFLTCKLGSAVAQW